MGWSGIVACEVERMVKPLWCLLWQGLGSVFPFDAIVVVMTAYALVSCEAPSDAGIALAS